VLHGPNGYLRSFAGDVGAAGGIGSAVSAALTYDAPSSIVVVELNATSATAAVNFTISDNAYGGSPSTHIVAAGGSASVRIDVSSSGRWYDLTVAAQPAAAGSYRRSAAAYAPLERRFMGRMENGEASITDPAMAAGIAGFAHDFARRRGVLPSTAVDTPSLARMPHPTLPPEHCIFPRKDGTHKDARWQPYTNSEL